MLQLMLSHFTFDGRGVPNSVNCFLTIPLVTGGKTPADCKRDRAGHFITALLLCAPQSPQEPQLRAQPSLGWCKHQMKKTVPAWEAYACIDRNALCLATARKVRLLPEPAAPLRASFTDGLFSNRL